MKAGFTTAVRAVLLLLSLGAAAETPPPVRAPEPPPSWQVETLSTTRSGDNDKPATLALATRAAVAGPLEHVLLYVSTFNRPMLKVGQGSTALVLNAPWVTAAAALNARGIAVAFADAPSDAKGRSLVSRTTAEIEGDLEAAVRQLKQRFPAAPIHLAGFGPNVWRLLDVASGVDGLARVVIASGDFRDNRANNWSGYKRPVLLVHAPSAQCDSAPFVEAELVARSNRFALVPAGYAQAEPTPNCGHASQHILTGLEAELAEMLSRWFDGAAAPATIGHPSPRIAWREQVVGYAAPTTFGSNRLEMTLLFPAGDGPFPLAIFNHGDIEIDRAEVRHKRRFVDKAVAREFLQFGWAVAFPSRPGVGLSEGYYGRFGSVDADATYKARIQAQDILPVFEYLKANPEIDSTRIIVSGQSAGGYAAMHLASLNLPGVIGAVDFSGGRTDKLTNTSAGYLNGMMVDGFAEFGKTTKVPTLWVFAENDSRYSVNTIRASRQAFVESGGKATLALIPAIEGDGHFVHQKPELWRAALRQYLADLRGPAHAR